MPLRLRHAGTTILRCALTTAIICGGIDLFLTLILLLFVILLVDGSLSMSDIIQGMFIFKTNIAIIIAVAAITGLVIGLISGIVRSVIAWIRN